MTRSRGSRNKRKSHQEELQAHNAKHARIVRLKRRTEESDERIRVALLDWMHVTVCDIRHKAWVEERRQRRIQEALEAKKKGHSVPLSEQDRRALRKADYNRRVKARPPARRARLLARDCCVATGLPVQYVAPADGKFGAYHQVSAGEDFQLISPYHPLSDLIKPETTEKKEVLIVTEGDPLSTAVMEAVRRERDAGNRVRVVDAADLNAPIERSMAVWDEKDIAPCPVAEDPEEDDLDDEDFDDDDFDEEEDGEIDFDDDEEIDADDDGYDDDDEEEDGDDA